MKWLIKATPNNQVASGYERDSLIFPLRTYGSDGVETVDVDSLTAYEANQIVQEWNDFNRFWDYELVDGRRLPPRQNKFKFKLGE